MKMKYCQTTLLLSLTLLVTGCKQQETSTPLPVKVKVTKLQPTTINNGQEFSGTVE